jgi:hypothetical protein
MSKRPAEDHENGGVPLKSGDRPTQDQLEDEVGEFEDEFEDEYESEDEILEAGVDGRPDADREAEEKAGEELLNPKSSWAHNYGLWLIFTRSYGRRPADIHSWQK